MILEDQNIRNSIDLHRPQKKILRNDFRISLPSKITHGASSFGSTKLRWLCLHGWCAQFLKIPKPSWKIHKVHQSTGPFSQMFFPVQMFFEYCMKTWFWAPRITAALLSWLLWLLRQCQGQVSRSCSVFLVERLKQNIPKQSSTYQNCLSTQYSTMASRHIAPSYWLGPLLERNIQTSRMVVLSQRAQNNDFGRSKLYQAGNPENEWKRLQSSAHKRFVSQKSGTNSLWCVLCGSHHMSSLGYMGPPQSFSFQSIPILPILPLQLRHARLK